MNIVTQSPRLAELLQEVMELYVSDHPPGYLTCSANGNCDCKPWLA
ncbi:MAG: hypothetical protein R3E93_12140 [Thiothrix sp.]